IAAQQFTANEMTITRLENEDGIGSEVWATLFNDKAVQVLGFTGNAYMSMTSDTERYEALDMLRGARVMATIRKRVAGQYVNYTVSELDDAAAAAATSSDVVGNGKEKVMEWLRNNSSEILFSSSVESCSPPPLIIITDDEGGDSSTSQPDVISISSSDEMEATAQEIPWDMYDEEDDDEDDEDQDAQFEFSPASPPLTKKGEAEDDTSPPTLYVFPDATVVLTPDGGSVRIPERSTNQPEPSTRKDEEEEEEEEASPEPCTSQAHASNLNSEVCKIMVEETISHIITNEWRKSSKTLDEVTTDICQSITATILSPQWHELMKTYARINIRRQP
ncbi:hypothetical protein LSAT2_002691, partial [Lamellibrachia satsuma]